MLKASEDITNKVSVVRKLVFPSAVLPPDCLHYRIMFMLLQETWTVKSTVHGRLDDVEISFSALKSAQVALGEQQKALKAEL